MLLSSCGSALAAQNNEHPDKVVSDPIIAPRNRRRSRQKRKIPGRRSLLKKIHLPKNHLLRKHPPGKYQRKKPLKQMSPRRNLFLKPVI